jgi:hypothetical protein
MQNISTVIDSYTNQYLPIRRHAKKYVSNNSTIDTNDRLNILHRPWLAPMNWALMLYKGVSNTLIEAAERKIKKTIPDFYSHFLTHINGAFLYDISLFGLTASLTRSYLQSHDLITANVDWISEYEVDPTFFYFGSYSYSDDENAGYFFGDRKIKSLLRNGQLINEWSDFSHFLDDELQRAENEMLKDLPTDVSLVVD